jgi:ABC-type antimicrobial peptide transport system permease subunit
VTTVPQDVRRTAPAANVPLASPPVWATIVGISPTIRQQYFQDIDPVVYAPDRAETPGLTLMVRSESAAVASAIRSEVGELDPEVSLGAIRPLEDLMTQSRWGHRVFGGMLTIFAFIALALASVGLHAVTAYSVVQRTQEVGIRIALGAQSREVLWLFGRQALLPLATGLTLGVAGSIGVGRLLRSLLVQTPASDPFTLLMVTALLVVVAFIASLGPARRATRLDPVAALRSE